MTFFSKEPKRRLFFAFTYVIFATWIIIDEFAWLNVVFSIPMVFCAYIAVVKSKIIKDKNANAIDDYKFDLYSIALTVFLIIHMMFR